MLHAPPDRELVCLYLSQLTPGIDFVDVQRIIQDARQREAGLGLRGALVFDGERFAQLIAGQPAQLDPACAFIESDPRMTAVRLLHRGTDTPPLRPGWSSGYCGYQDLDLVIEAGAGGAMQAFLHLLEGAVMD